jgi:MFS family permease
MQGGLVGRLVKRFGERALLLAGLALLVAGLALLPLGTSVGAVLIALGIVSLAEGAITPTATALLSFASPPDAQGATLGLSQGLGGLGRVLGPLIAGGLFTIHAGLPFLAGAILAVGALVVAVPAFSTASPAEPAATAQAALVRTAFTGEEGTDSHRPIRPHTVAFSRRATRSLPHPARTASAEYISRNRPTGSTAIRRTSTKPAAPARYSNDS